MQRNKGDDININEFMNDIILDQYLFPSLEMIITNSSNATIEDNGDFLVKVEDILNLISLVLSNCD